MVQLFELIESYKREVAPPGAFDTTFPSMAGTTGEDHILGALADGFAEAQLDGFFGTHALDMDAFTVTPELSVAGGALVVIYAGMRTVRNQLRGTSTSTRYKSGPVEYETQQSASVLTEMLKDFARRRQELLALGRRSSAVSTYVLDGYYSRMMISGGFGAAEIAAVPVALGSL